MIDELEPEHDDDLEDEDPVDDVIAAARRRAYQRAERKTQQ